MSISILIPIFNGLQFTQSCLNSLFLEHKIESKELDIHVVITDDGSTDGSSDWINSTYPQVSILKGNGNLWWSGGINLGIEHAINVLKSDYVLWWNNDIVADKNYFDNLTEVISNNGIDTIIGSKIFHAHTPDIVWSMGGVFNPFNGHKDMIGTGEADNDSLQKPVEVDWLPGMGTCIHKTVFDKIGVLDEKTFPQYHGDSDFTYKAKINGFNVTTFPSLKIYNDTRHSGLRHQDSFSNLMRSMTTIRSNYNIKKDIAFYRRYAKSMKAYGVIWKKYFRYVGGFFKWKILNLLGKKR